MFLVLAVAACSEETTLLDVAPANTAVASSTVPADAIVPSTTIDTSAAEADIRHAFAMLANTNVTQAERDAAIEDGEQTSAARAGQFEKYKDQAAQISFVVDEIRITSATMADVDFHLQPKGAVTPNAPNIVHGGAVVQGGHWRVSKKTTCLLAALVGNRCD
jgi:hypothetical protein